MATDILIKRSTTSGAVPTTGDLSTGELAVNTADKRLFTNNSGTIVEIGIAPTSLAVTNNATVGGTLGVTGTTTVATGTATNWTVSGTLTVSTPSNSTDAASKGYVDTADALKVAKAGDTMSGDLAMGTNKVTGLGTPTASTDAATKGYVDAQVTAVIDSAPGALDTLNELAAAINDDANFATTVTNALAGKLALAGGTMTGDITLGANKATSTATPATDDTLTRKGYVDTQDATKLNLSGGTLTGDITLGANKATSTATPTTDDTLTRKGYVDSILGSATDAATSATAAASSATDAANSATAAATSATNAATSASNASTSETNAATSASAASSSATASANSATSAASSATAAATSAAQAAASYDSFDDRYLGSKTSDPTLDNDGNALVTGALYFNSTDGEMRIYDGSVWIAASSASVETMEKFAFTATSGQTVFTGTDDNAKTLALTVGAEMVTLNGVVLEETTDYTRTSDTITLTSGATTDDELNVFAFGNFTVADTVSASTGGTFTGAVTFDGGINGNTNVTGTVTADGLTLSSTNPIINLTDTDTNVDHSINANSSNGGLIINADINGEGAAGRLQMNVAGTQTLRIDSGGDISFYEDTGTTPKLFWDASAECLNVGTTTSEGKFNVNVSAPADYPFRFTNTSSTGYGLLVTAGDGSTALAKFRDYAGNDRVYISGAGNVGIGTASPSYQVTIETAGGSGGTASSAADNLVIDGGGLGNHGISILAGSGYNSSIYMGDESSSIQGYVQYNHPSDYMRFATNGTERMRIGSTGNVSVGSTDTSAHQLLVADLANRAQGASQFRIQGSGYSAWHHLDGTAYYIGQNSNSRRVRIYSGNNPAVGVNLAAAATSWGTYSDERLKTDVEPITDGVDKLANLRCVSYRLKSDESDAPKKLGLIAQDLQGVMDEVIDSSVMYGDDETEYLSVRYTEIIPVLIKAIQEQQEQINELKAQVATLQGN